MRADRVDELEMDVERNRFGKSGHRGSPLAALAAGNSGEAATTGIYSPRFRRRSGRSAAWSSREFASRSSSPTTQACTTLHEAGKDDSDLIGPCRGQVLDEGTSGGTTVERGPRSSLTPHGTTTDVSSSRICRRAQCQQRSHPHEPHEVLLGHRGDADDRHLATHVYGPENNKKRCPTSRSESHAARPMAGGMGLEGNAPRSPHSSMATSGDGESPSKHNSPAVAPDAAGGGLAVNVPRAATTMRLKWRGDQLGAHAGSAVTTTRSGRRSIPVMDFSRTAKSIDGKAKDPRSVSTTAVVFHRPTKTRQNLPAKGRATSRSSLKKSTIVKDVPARKRRKASRTAGSDCGIVAGLPEGGTSAFLSGRTAQEDGMPVTRSGRRSAHVLDWWRSQSLSRTPNGEVLESFRPSQAIFLPEMPMVPPSRQSWPKATGFDRQGASDGHEASWTRGQLHKLHTAQMATDPSAKDFWGAVASNVEGRDPQQCQQKWFEHFASPKCRRRKTTVVNKGTTSQKMDAPLTGETTKLSHDIFGAGACLPQLDQTPKRADADDLFLATPMRGRSRLGVQPRGCDMESSTPRTPAGPGAPIDVASSPQATSEEGRADYMRGISRTYVQAMSKKMRKAYAASRSGSAPMVMRGKASKKQTARLTGRTVHAAAISGGRSLKASVSVSGAVSIASTGSSDADEGFGSSDDQESETD